MELKLTEPISTSRLASVIQIHPDLEAVSIGDQHFLNALHRSKSELVNWLYAVLHAKNPGMLESLEGGFTKSGLSELIPYEVKEKSLPVRCRSVQEHSGDETGILSNGFKIRTTSTGRISLPCYRPRLSPGFAMFRHFVEDISPQKVARYYRFSDDPEQAIEVWSGIVLRLSDAGLSFASKVLSDEKQYPRTDAIVLYCDASDSSNRDLLETILIKESQRFCAVDQDSKSFFTRELRGGSGVYTADESIGAIAQGLSFGQHRSAVLADAILDSFLTGISLEKTFLWRAKSESVDTSDLSRNTI